MAMKNSNKKLNFYKHCYKKIKSAKLWEWRSPNAELGLSLCRMCSGYVEGLGPRRRFFDSLRAQGCRPFSTEIEPLALFPGVSNPRMTSGRCGVPVGFPNVSELGDLSTPFSRSRWQVESVMFRICWGFRSWRRESYRNIEAEQSV